MSLPKPPASDKAKAPSKSEVLASLLANNKPPSAPEPGQISTQEIQDLFARSENTSPKRFTKRLRERGYKVTHEQVRNAIEKHGKTLTDEQVQQMWQDPKMGLIGPSTFAKKLRKKGYVLSQGQVERALADDATRDIMQQKRTSKRSRYPVYANEDGQYMADLAFLPKLASSQPGRQNTILTIVNMNTGKGYAYALKGKKSGEQSNPNVMANVNTRLKQFFRTATPKVTTFQTDSGSEFTSKAMKKLYKDNKIDHITVISGEKHNAQGNIERFNRTLKKRLDTYMVEQGNNDWVSGLDDIVANYNDTPHSGNPQNNSPNEMGQDDVVLKRLRSRIKAHQMLFNDAIDYQGEGGEQKKNTKVRIRTNIGKGAFDKEGQPWSTEVFTVVGPDGLGYRLKDSSGKPLRRKYMAYEMKPTQATKRRNPVTETREDAIKKSKVDKDQEVLRRERADKLGSGPKDKAPQTETQLRRSERKRTETWKGKI